MNGSLKVQDDTGPSFGLPPDLPVASSRLRGCSCLDYRWPKRLKTYPRLRKSLQDSATTRSCRPL